MFGWKKVTTKKGKTITLLNPGQRGRKFAQELKEGYAISNSGKYRVDEDGPIPLTDTQRAFRSVYLASRKDGAKCHKYLKKKSNSDKNI